MCVACVHEEPAVRNQLMRLRHGPTSSGSAPGLVGGVPDALIAKSRGWNESDLRRGIGQELEFGGDRVFILGGDAQPALQVGDVDRECRGSLAGRQNDPGSPQDVVLITRAQPMDLIGQGVARLVGFPGQERVGPHGAVIHRRSGAATGGGCRSGRAGPLPRRCSDPGSGDFWAPRSALHPNWRGTSRPSRAVQPIAIERSRLRGGNDHRLLDPRGDPIDGIDLDGPVEPLEPATIDLQRAAVGEDRAASP